MRILGILVQKNVKILYGYSRINLTNNADDIAAKDQKAKTDPLSLPENR